MDARVDPVWDEQFNAAVSSISGDVGYEESAAQLRSLIKTRLLKYSDLHTNPERFFRAHRILAARATELGPGFWIRFTVQYNLFGGTILGLAADHQLPLLEALEEQGHLGCFGLTERFAGVNSGFLVNTRADWDASSKTFVLSSPNLGAEKNWISQGFVADKALVMASLFVDDKPLGPHAFVMDLRSDGQLVEGVELTDMGRKTVGNDLDNASIKFTNVHIPHDALLSKFCALDKETGVYSVTEKGIKPFTMIGQRLFTGRVAVAQAALAFRASLFAKTKEYSDSKKCWAPPSKDGTSTDMRLSDIPQLTAIYQEGERRGRELEQFVEACEKELSATLVARRLPSDETVGAIAVAKVLAVEESIALCLKLKQEVGSYALMAGTGFDQLDFLQCTKFAEGDSRILMLKMARDRLRLFQKGKPGDANEDELCKAISAKMQSDLGASGGNEQQAWDNQYEAVYRLAGMVMDRVYRNTVQSK